MRNKFYDNWKNHVIQNNASNDDDKPRSYAEQMFPIYICSWIGIFIIHCLSFGGAVIWPSYLFELLFGSMFWGFFIGSIILIIFEIIKFTLADTIFENYFKSGIISYGMITALGIMYCFSITSSTNGFPIAIFRLSPDAELKDPDAIRAEYKLQEDEVIAKWEPKAIQASARVDSFKSNNEKFYPAEGRKRLSRSTKIRNAYNDLLKSRKEAEEALQSQLLLVAANLDEALKEARFDNKYIEENHKFKKEKAGNIGFWLMLILEFCGLLLICWRRYYKDRSKHEQNAPEEANKTQQEETETGGKVVRLQTEQEQTEQEEQAEKQAVAKEQNKPNKIGFRTHGEIFYPDGSSVPHVRYKTKRGGWTSYPEHKLRSMARKKDASESWKTELLDLADKLHIYSQSKT